jgi:microcystin-dependent protein
MAEPFIGQIIIAGFNFAPRGYATCDGQLLSIAQNTALFSLLGVTYGGNGQTTFGLPDLRGRVPIHQGQGPGLTNRTMGELSGTENVTLLTANLPSHSHSLIANSSAGNQGAPVTGSALAASSARGTNNYSSAAPNTVLAAQSVGNAGNGQPFSIMQPYLVVNYAIALQGIFPSRN